MRPSPIVAVSLVVACGSEPAGDPTSADSTSAAATTDVGPSTSSGTATTASPSTTGADPDATGADTSSEASSTGEPHMVLPCDAIGDAGAWANITPPDVDLGADFETPAGENYGMHSFVVDPQNTATVFAGTSAQGIFRSDDCGATWVHVNTGRNGDVLDAGRQWTFVIDPVDPDVLYTNTGYGAFNAWKSTNGGVDWDLLIQTPEVAALQFGGFVQFIRMDPTNHQHLLVTPHFECEVGAVDGLPLTPNCLLESMDAGETWTIREGAPLAGESASQFMLDSQTWFWAEGFTGLARTGNGGATWEHVYSDGYATAGMFQRADGTLFTGGVFSVLQSPDGLTWSSIPDSPGAEFIVGDDTTMYAARGAGFHSAPTDDPSTWTPLPTPEFPEPDNVLTWGLVYDVDHRLLYSLNSRNGLWRLRLE